MKKFLFPLIVIFISIQSCSVSNEKNSAVIESVDADGTMDNFDTEAYIEEEAEYKNGESASNSGFGTSASAPIMDSTSVTSGKKKNKSTWKRSEKSENTVSLFIGDNDELPMDAGQMVVTVDGFRARVLMDCFFFHKESFQAEGTFKMKLPQGASPYYFAFGESVYIDKNKKEVPFVNYEQVDFTPEGIRNMRSENWKSPKEAVVVEKEKAAFAYTQTVRRQIDPALAEWSGADIFNCRVFPLIPEKLHRIVIGYDVDLTTIGNDKEFILQLPDSNAPMVLDFNIAEVSSFPLSITPQQKMTSQSGYQKFKITNPKEEEIKIRYQGMQNIALISDKEEKEKYFAAQSTPDLPKNNTNNISDKAIIALDISLSSQPDKFNIWLNLAEKILKNNQDVIQEFNVLFFNVETYSWKENMVKNTTGNVDDFIRFAQGTVLQGASDLGIALDEIKKINSNKNIFLLSDGNITWGKSEPYALSNSVNKGDMVFAYNSGMSGTSISTLRHLTRETGGSVFAVTGEDELNNASKAFRNQAWKLENISIDGVDDLLIEGRPSFIYPGQEITLSGRQTNTIGNKIQLKVSQNGNNKTITIPIRKTIPSSTTKRIYGKMATDGLEEFGYDTEKYAVSYARHFKIPGKTCSFLMLETQEDYNQFNIKSTEDDFVVKNSTAGEIIRKTIREIGSLLGNPKAGFKKWMKKLTGLQGFEFEIPTSLEMLVEKIPENKFAINSKGLSCKKRKKSEIESEVMKELKKRKPDYDLISNSAEKLKTDKLNHDALRLLSSLVEKNPGDAVMTRDVAFSAMEMGMEEQAYFLFKRVLEKRPYEPQTYHAIARNLDKMGHSELAVLYYEIALSAKWDNRFGDFNEIAKLDYLNMLKKLKSTPSFSLKEYTDNRLEKLQSEFKESEKDLLITISWNTDNTDIDLHVIEPSGEECYYSHPKTKSGGQLTKDVTTGYGPEMYTLTEAKKGKYTVKVKYYSSNRNRSSTRTKVYANIYKNWGTPQEEVIRKVISLADKKEMHDVAVIKI